MPRDRQTELLEELLAWTRIGFYGVAKNMLADVLDTDNKRLAYQLADGLTSIDAIKAGAGIGSNTANDLFKQCLNLGLMEMTPDGKRRRLFDLTNFGLMPQMDVVKKKGAGGGSQ
jgi:Fic family protein